MTMKDHSAVLVEHVSKKYCKGLKRSMLYGLSDIARNSLGMSAHSERLRKEEFWAVDDVSFTLEKGSTLGLIGPNGSGKTTLLKMLNGIFWPDRGRITISGRLGALIEVGAGFHPLLTGRQNIYINAAILGMSKAEIDRKFDQIVEFADIGDFLDAPVKHYSSGMFVRLGFAVAVHSEPDILLIDEVLAVGDRGFQEKCFNKIGELRKKGTTTILVSHNMHMIATFSDKLLLVNRGLARQYAQVEEGIKDYNKLFIAKGDHGIEDIRSGNDHIRFFDVSVDKHELEPGESVEISLKYQSERDYSNIEVDTGIYGGSDALIYFLTTNQAYNRQLSLEKGTHELKIKIHNIQINNSLAKVIIGIWSEHRTELLFWWRIPIELKAVDYSRGSNFLQVSYMNG